MIETFRTIKGFNRVDKEKWFVFRNTANSRATRSTVLVTADGQQQQLEREDTLFMESVRLDTRRNFFSVRVVNQWNKLPGEIRQQKTVNGFKNRYDEWNRKEKAKKRTQNTNLKGSTCTE